MLLNDAVLYAVAQAVAALCSLTPRTFDTKAAMRMPAQGRSPVTISCSTTP